MRTFASLILVLAAWSAFSGEPDTKKSPEKKPAEPAKKTRSELMDYGPFLTASFGQGKDNYANKGIAVKLSQDPAHPAFICFDTDLMRISAAWTGDFIDYTGLAFRGGWGIARGPNINGKIQFSTKPAPGWTKEQERKPQTERENIVQSEIGMKFSDTKDARTGGSGPLPHDWAQYKGLYLNGNKVIFSYTIGDVSVLEMPGVQFEGETAAFSRTISVGANTKPMTLLVCEGTSPVRGDFHGTNCVAVKDGESQVAAGIVGMPDGASWVGDGNRLYLRLHPSDKPRTFKLVLAREQTPPADFMHFLAGGVEDITALTKGGPARWTEKIETQGILGKDDDAYTVDTITPPETNPWNSWLRFGAHDFFSDGRAAITTWSGDVWIVSGLDAKLDHVTWKRFATGLFQPLGLKIVNDQIYVLSHGPIVRLHDLNNDGEADFYECFNNDCCVTNNYHEFACDLQTDADGNFYFTKGAPALAGRKDFEAYTPHHGALLKVSKDGKTLEVVANGFREPNGIGISPRGEITVTDNQGNWQPECPLNLVKKGGFYGMPDPASKNPMPTRDPALCWLPYNMDNSSGSQTWVNGDKFGPLKDRMLLTSYGKCALYHVMFERDPAGVPFQAATVKWPLVFSSGVMRARFHPQDGQLYVTGLKGWGTSAGKDGAFQRVRYTGKPCRLPLDFKITPSGAQIVFDCALDKESATDVSNWSAEWFNVVATKEYGSPEFSVSEPQKKARETLAIRSVSLGADGKTLAVEIPGLKPVTNLVIKFKIKAADGALISHEIDSTINRVP
jgi:hypothetical protein